MFFRGEIPFLRILLAYCSGIVLAIWIPNEQLNYWSVPFLFIFLFIFFFVLLVYATWRIFRTPWIAGIVVNLLLIIVAYHYTVRSSQKFNKFHFSKFEYSFLVAKVSDEPHFKNGIQRFKAEVLYGVVNKDLSPVHGNILISINPDSSIADSPEYGDLIIFPGEVSAVGPSYNPGEFDYSGWLANKQIYHQVFFRSSEYRIIKTAQGNQILSFAIKLRKKLVENYERYIPDKQSSSLASALILGYRAEMNRELVQTYSKTGTIHVLSVSGMHVALIFLVASRFLRFMEHKAPLRIIRALLIVAIIWSYAMLTGFSAPANRAACMISFIVIGKAINRSQNRYNILAIAAFLLLLYNPYNLIDMGFQLSFLAVLGIFYFQLPIANLLVFKSKLLATVWNYISLSMAAQLATFPLAMYYFHQFPVYFLLSNLFIVLPVSVIMYAGILFLIIPIEGVQYLLGVFLSEMIRLTNAGLMLIEKLPLSSISGIWLECYELFIIIMIFLFLILRTFNYRLAFGAALRLMLLLCCCLSFKKVSCYFKSDLLLYSFSKNSGLAFSQLGESIIISDLPVDHSSISYSILPGIQSRGNSAYVLLDYNQSSTGRAYFCRPGFLQFCNFKLLRWTPDFDNKKFVRVLTVDALLIGENARSSLAEISTWVDFDQLFIEGNNNSYVIKRYYEEAALLKKPVYVLKKNPARIIKL